MSAYKEIVTKAVVGKGKKYYKNTYKVNTDSPVDTVLGCWVINHPRSERCREWDWNEQVFFLRKRPDGGSEC